MQKPMMDSPEMDRMQGFRRRPPAPGTNTGPVGRPPEGGAKGLGELPMDGPMPAVLNALQHALGPELPLDEVPMTPERLLDRLEEVGRA